MFVPSDGIYHAALAQDPSLIDYGVQQQVLLATPTTLIGLLRAVHYGWRQEQVAQSARELAHSSRELHHRLGRFVDLFASSAGASTPPSAPTTKLSARSTVRSSRRSGGSRGPARSPIVSLRLRCLSRAPRGR